MVRFAVTPPPKTVRAPRVAGFAAQIALAQIHPLLVPVQPVPGGYALDAELTRAWFELPAQRGLAGYGLARALRMLLDVLSGLSALHDTKTESGARFVHGEVVPALLRVDGQGVARLIPLAPWHRLEVGAALARERQGHLAPERLLGDVIDQRADVFSCGVLLWEALAGGRLFETESVDAIVTRLMGGKLELPELPPELAWAAPLKSVAMCALAVDPTQRFPDCSALASAIEAVAGAHIASHEEVATFFGARVLASQRPSSSLIISPRHTSSLSALVAPALPRSEPQNDEELTLLMASPELSPAPSSVGPKLWITGALLGVLAALGASVITQHHAAHRASSGPNQSAIGGVSVPGALPASEAFEAFDASSASDASDAAAAAGNRAPRLEPLSPSAPPLAPQLGAHDKHPASGGRPSAAGVPARPSKVAPTHDRASDQYGI